MQPSFADIFYARQSASVLEKINQLQPHAACQYQDISVENHQSAGFKKIHALPVFALPVQDLKALDHAMPAHGVYGHPDFFIIAIETALASFAHASVYLKKNMARLLEKFNTQWLVVIRDPQGCDFEGEGRTYTYQNNANENCLAGLQCPSCATHRMFNIEVTGILPGQVDAMDSQMSVMRKLSEGELETGTYETAVYDSGLDEADGDTEWDENSSCRCVKCGYHGSIRDFQTLHDSEYSRSDDETHAAA